MFDELIQRQAGAIGREQLLACGKTDDEVRSQLRAARWQRLYWGVYYVHNGPVPRDARLWGAVLRAGPGAMLSHETAAEVYGLVPQPLSRIHVTIPASRRVRGERDLVIHPAVNADRVRNAVLEPPRTRIDETVLDLVHTSASFGDALGWVTRACGGRLTTSTRLRKALDGRSRMRWRAELETVIGYVEKGSLSPLEVCYAHSVESAHGLPMATRQRATRHGGRSQYNDVHYDGYATTVELDGRIGHEGQHRFRDMRRDNTLVVEGEAVLRYGWFDVCDEPCRVAEQVWHVLQDRGWRGTPHPCPRPTCPFRA